MKVKNEDLTPMDCQIMSISALFYSPCRSTLQGSENKKTPPSPHGDTDVFVLVTVDLNSARHCDKSPLDRKRFFLTAAGCFVKQ